MEYISWDSSFFKKEIFKLKIESEFSIRSLKDLLPKKYDLVYLISSRNFFGNQITDKKQIFSCADFKVISNTNIKFSNIEIEEFDNSKLKIDKLYNLSIQSGIYSRFKRDQFFSQVQFEELYKRWIRNSVEDESKKVLVSILNKSIVGFVSYHTIGNKLVIELLAVDQEYRGKAIGSSLISTLKKIAQEKQLCEIEVVTQGVNLSAVKFYTKNKFKLKDTQYIFHYWNPKKYEYTI